jgi:hypothetical protein
MGGPRRGVVETVPSVGFDGGRPSKWSTRLTTVGVRVRPVSSARVSRALVMACWRRAICCGVRVGMDKADSMARS